MKIIIIYIAAVLCTIVNSSNELDSKQAGDDSLPVDYDQIYLVHRVCARQWGVDYYEIVIEDNVEYNETVRCALECEMKARKQVGKTGKLLIEEINRDYLKEYASDSSEDARKMREFVINGCYKEVLQQEKFEKCELAFKFYQCQMRKQRDWYTKKDLEASLNVWEGTTKTEYNHEYCQPGSFTSFGDILTMIQQKGVEYFGSVLNDTSFLSERTEEKQLLLRDIKKCYKMFKSGSTIDGEKCRNDLKMYVCIVSKFEKVIF